MGGIGGELGKGGAAGGGWSGGGRKGGGRDGGGVVGGAGGWVGGGSGEGGDLGALPGACGGRHGVGGYGGRGGGEKSWTLCIGPLAGGTSVRAHLAAFRGVGGVNSSGHACRKRDCQTKRSLEDFKPSEPCPLLLTILQCIWGIPGSKLN